MGNRHSRNLEATKEIFFPFTGIGETQATSVALGAHTGILVNANGEYAYGEGYIPWNFSHLVEGKIVLLSYATLTPMNFRVVTDYCPPETAYFLHNSLKNINVNTVLNRVQEANIADALVDLTDSAPLEAENYLGVQVSRQVGQNTNALFLGVRIRYNTPIYAKAP